MLMVLVSLTLLTSCGKVDEVNEVTNIEEVEEVSESFDVALSEIPKPEVGEFYLVVNSIDVTYGVGENWLDVSSGLPGFDFPMLIYFSDFEMSESIEVSVPYGVYRYKLETTQDINLENVSNEINFGLAEEKLYIYSKGSKTLGTFSFVDGPSIGL